MKIQPSHHCRAFSAFEVLVVISVLVLLAVVLLPMLAARHQHRSMINCANNLKQVGLALRIWEGDNGDKYPMFVPTALGGAQELIATGNVAACFQVMSNELSTPKILVCPKDSRHSYATNFEADFTRAHLSYFIGVVSNSMDPYALVSGDANLTQSGRSIPAGTVNLGTNTFSWTRDRHGASGYILLGDDSVQTATQIGFTSSLGTYFATNPMVIP